MSISKCVKLSDYLDFSYFKSNYNIINKFINSRLKKYEKIGMEKFCLNTDIIKTTPNIFNIELPNTKIYDQEESLICWLYAGINFITYDIATNLNILPKDVICFHFIIDKNGNICSSSVNRNKVHIDYNLISYDASRILDKEEISSKVDKSIY